MGDFNPATPVIRGMEYRPARLDDFVLSSPGSGLLQRIRSPGAVTFSHVHHYIKAAAGSPGVGIEILDTIAPAKTETEIFPGSDNGAVVTGWADQAGSTTTANIRGAVDDHDLATFARNVAQVPSNSKLAIKFSGSGSPLSGRVVSIWIGADMRMVPGGTTGIEARVRGVLNLGGSDYVRDEGIRVPTNNIWVPKWVARWDLNPATNLPWTLTEANELFDADVTDVFGLEVFNTLVAAQGFNLGGLYVKAITVPENRKGYFYSALPPQAGWTERVLAATAALTANTHYWLHVFAFRGTGNDQMTIPATRDDNVVRQNDPAVSTVGEHRELSVSRLDYASGCIGAILSGPNPAMMPALLDVAGTIQSPSNPYAALDFLTFQAGATANRGQQVTTAAADDYAGIQLPIGWASATRPDRALVLEVRSGGGAISGGGTLVATATLLPDATAGATITDRLVIFDTGPVALAATTQYHVLISSAASSGRGWKIPRLDTRSDRVVSGTTVAEIEGASQGGQTDSYVENGAALDRYDLPLALIATPDGPATLTVDVEAAA